MILDFSCSRSACCRVLSRPFVDFHKPGHTAMVTASAIAPLRTKRAIIPVNATFDRQKFTETYLLED